jgi:hypothetical protein
MANVPLPKRRRTPLSFMLPPCQQINLLIAARGRGLFVVLHPQVGGSAKNGKRCEDCQLFIERSLADSPTTALPSPPFSKLSLRKERERSSRQSRTAHFGGAEIAYLHRASPRGWFSGAKLFFHHFCRVFREQNMAQIYSSFPFFSVVSRRPLWGCTMESGRGSFSPFVCVRRGTGALAFTCGPAFQSLLVCVSRR